MLAGPGPRSGSTTGPPNCWSRSPTTGPVAALAALRDGACPACGDGGGGTGALGGGVLAGGLRPGGGWLVRARIPVDMQATDAASVNAASVDARPGEPAPRAPHPAAAPAGRA